MFLRRKQKPNDDEQPIPHGWSWQATEREELGRPKTETAPFAEFSKLTAKMVELSLQEAQRQRTTPGSGKTECSPVVFALAFHRCPGDPGETRRKRRKSGNGGCRYASDPATGARDTWRTENRKLHSFVLSGNDDPPGDDKLRE